MEFIADHILWLLLAGWVVSVLIAGRALLAVWRWLRPASGHAARNGLKLVGALLLLAAGGVGLLFTSSGLVAMGPGILAQQRMIGSVAPNFAYTRVADGAAASLADHEGSVILVSQWATWCPPCLEEMPDLERLQQTYGERGLVILHVSDESRDVLAEYLARRPMSTEHGQADPLPWPDTGRPTTFLLDREGVLRQVVLGIRSYDQFEALVVPLL